MFIQNVNIDLECLRTELNLNIVFGIKDNLSKKFNQNDWTIMNQNWFDFNSKTSITENCLWGDEIPRNERSLQNAKLYPVLNANLKQDEMLNLSQYFWIDLNRSKPSKTLINNWKQSLRFSLDDLSSIINLEKMFNNRREMYNLVNINYLIKNVVRSRPINFVASIRNAVHDGYADEVLRMLDEGLKI